MGQRPFLGHLLLLVAGFASPALAQEDWEQTRPPVLVVEDLLGKDWKAARQAREELARIGARGVPSLLEARVEAAPESHVRRPIDDALRQIVGLLSEQVARPLLGASERVSADGALGGLIGACDRDRPDTRIVAIEPDDFGDLGSITAIEPQDWFGKRDVARRARSALVRLGPPATGFLAEDPVLEPAHAQAVNAVLRTIYQREREAILNLPNAQARQAFRARYKGVADLTVPVLAAGIRDPEAKVRAVFQGIRDEVLEGALAQLDADSPKRREAAEDTLFRLGQLAVPSLDRVAAGKVAEHADAHSLAAAARLARRIRFGVSAELVRKIGHDFEHYAELEFRERRKLVFELERLGGKSAIPALRALLTEDPSLSVRTVAAIGLFRLGDPVGSNWLAMHTQALPLPQISKRDLAAIYMDQGLGHLKFGRFERAEKEFKSVLEVEPQNDIGWYNLACTYSRWGKVDQALDALKKAVQFGFDDTSHMKKDPDLDNLREDPRYKAIIRGIEAEKNPDADLEDLEEPEAPDEDEEDGLE